jgi:hypothetical protein
MLIIVMSPFAASTTAPTMSAFFLTRKFAQQVRACNASSADAMQSDAHRSSGGPPARGDAEFAARTLAVRDLTCAVRVSSCARTLRLSAGMPCCACRRSRYARAHRSASFAAPHRADDSSLRRVRDSAMQRARRHVLTRTCMHLHSSPLFGGGYAGATRPMSTFIRTKPHLNIGTIGHVDHGTHRSMHAHAGGHPAMHLRILRSADERYASCNAGGARIGALARISAYGCAPPADDHPPALVLSSHVHPHDR